MRMNRDNRSVSSGKSSSSRPLQVYFLPTLQRKRKRVLLVKVNHETTTHFPPVKSSVTGYTFEVD